MPKGLQSLGRMRQNSADSIFDGKICEDAEDAGNFTDDTDMVAKRHVDTALKRLESILGKKPAAQAVLKRLGWVE